MDSLIAFPKFKHKRSYERIFHGAVAAVDQGWQVTDGNVLPKKG